MDDEKFPLYTNESLPDGCAVVVGWLEVNSDTGAEERYWSYGKISRGGWDGRGTQPKKVSIQNYAFRGGRLVPTWVAQAALDTYRAGGVAPLETASQRKPRHKVAFVDEIDVENILFKSPAIDLQEETHFVSEQAHAAIRHHIFEDTTQCFDRIGQRCRMCAAVRG